MGLPAIQLIMIAARQVSKPIAEALINYGKNHPLFRNRVLIPVGRSLVHLTTRLRMKKMGLGSPTSVATVSEATALEQASDFIQQVVLFSYSVGVFAGYYYWTKWFSPETMKVDEFEKWKEESQRESTDLMLRIKRLEDALIAAKWKLSPLPEAPKKEEETSPSPPSSPPSAVASAAQAAAMAAPAATPSPTVVAKPAAAETKKESASSPSPAPPTPPPSPSPSPPSSLTSSILRFPRISSLPLDSASKIVLEGEPYTYCKRDTSISFERGDPDLRFLRFRPKENPHYSPGFVGLSERALGYITGCA